MMRTPEKSIRRSPLHEPLQLCAPQKIETFQWLRNRPIWWLEGVQEPNGANGGDLGEDSRAANADVEASELRRLKKKALSPATLYVDNILRVHAMVWTTVNDALLQWPWDNEVFRVLGPLDPTRWILACWSGLPATSAELSSWIGRRWVKK